MRPSTRPRDDVGAASGSAQIQARGHATDMRSVSNCELSMEAALRIAELVGVNPVPDCQAPYASAPGDDGACPIDARCAGKLRRARPRTQPEHGRRTEAIDCGNFHRCRNGFGAPAQLHVWQRHAERGAPAGRAAQPPPWVTLPASPARLWPSLSLTMRRGGPDSLAPENSLTCGQSNELLFVGERWRRALW